MLTGLLNSKVVGGMLVPPPVSNSKTLHEDDSNTSPGNPFSLLHSFTLTSAIWSSISVAVALMK